MATDAITEGVLTGVKRVSSGVDTPAYTDKAVVSFTTAGSVPVGGSIRVSLPAVVSVQAGWVIASDASVVFSSPSSSTPVVMSGADVSVTDGGRVATFKISSNELKQGAVVVFKVANVTTPTRQLASASTTAITTFDSSGNIIDSASDVATDALTPGVLGGALRFDTHVDKAHYTGHGTIGFTTAGSWCLSANKSKSSSRI